MTRGEAIKIIKECKEKGFKHTFYTLNEYYTALDMAITALEQEPCEDAISRQAALDLIKGFIADATSHGISPRLDPDYVMDGIKALPPVNPQPKTGHWINGDCEGGNCSICGKYYAFYPESGDFNYCPNCGAKMIEPQESEEIWE